MSKESRALSAAKIVDTATVTAQDVIKQATDEAREVVKEQRSELHNSLVEIVNDALGRTPTRYFDASRIPLLCKSIFDINDKLKELKENMDKDGHKYVTYDIFNPIKSIVYGGTGAILLALLGAIVALVIKR